MCIDMQYHNHHYHDGIQYSIHVCTLDFGLGLWLGVGVQDTSRTEQLDLLETPWGARYWIGWGLISSKRA